LNSLTEPFDYILWVDINADKENKESLSRMQFCGGGRDYRRGRQGLAETDMSDTWEFSASLLVRCRDVSPVPGV